MNGAVSGVTSRNILALSAGDFVTSPINEQPIEQSLCICVEWQMEPGFLPDNDDHTQK